MNSYLLQKLPEPTAGEQMRWYLRRLISAGEGASMKETSAGFTSIRSISEQRRPARAAVALSARHAQASSEPNA